MCGIFFYGGDNDNEKIIEESFHMIKHRGPDMSFLKKYSTNNTDFWLGFHRLAINDLSEKGMQPFESTNTSKYYTICNGEIYNFNKIKQEDKLKTENYYSNSDCEIIIKLFQNNYDPKIIPTLLDGVFSFIVVSPTKNRIWIARDPFGVRSLYWHNSLNNLAVCSELKGLSKLLLQTDKIDHFPPGYIAEIRYSDKQLLSMTKYHNISEISHRSQKEYSICQEKCVHLLRNVVKKRMTSDRKIGAFLSGGLDSSIICSLIAENYQNKKNFHTFSIGMVGSTDLVFAKKVAEHIGSTHHEIIITEEQLISMVEETIYYIETYDTTTIRASTPMLTLSKHIRKHFPEIVVIFSGEGSDEICGSYMYFHNAPDKNSFHKECKTLIHELDHYDVLRGDKCTAGTGLEIRVPFLDKSFVDFYLSLPIEWRLPNYYLPGNSKKIEKHFLRSAFESFGYNNMNQSYLPKEVIWRVKEAFSDGVSSTKRSWFTMLQSWIDNNISDDTYHTNKKNFRYWLTPNTKENYYYRTIFEKYYPNKGYLLNHYWLPKWSGDIQDPSARILSNYQ